MLELNKVPFSTYKRFHSGNAFTVEKRNIYKKNSSSSSDIFSFWLFSNFTDFFENDDNFHPESNEDSMNSWFLK